MKTWSYLMNPFLIVGLKNFKGAVKISTYTDGVLLAKSADPFYLAQYTIYHKLHLALVAAYTNWKSQGGTQKGATLSLDQLLTLLSPGKINLWDLAVMNVFAKSSPQYVTIFPQGHKPFTNGAKDARINTVKTLGTALIPFGGLAATKTDVDGFYTLLNNARTGQQGQKGNTGTDSDGVTNAVTAAMTGLYALLGICMNNMAATPTAIEPLFDLQTIRDHEQSIFTGLMHGGEDEGVFEHGLLADDELKLESPGATTTDFYFSVNGLPGVNGYTVISVGPGLIKTVKRSDFGADMTNHFLHAMNPGAVDGHFRVSIL